jgi:radical SAM protein with 4Fe4S-binding SPASM domain
VSPDSVSSGGGFVRKVRVGGYPLWKGAGPLLQHLDVELTERCNNDCIHCYINLPEEDDRALAQEQSTEALLAILREAAELGALSVRFTGGEPLLRPDFSELYLAARRLGLRVLLFTNGRLITEELADLFARVPPLEPIELTVYGMHRHSYEAVTRSPGSYGESRRGLQRLLDHRVPLTLKWVSLPPNRTESGEFLSWARTLPTAEPPSMPVPSLYLRARRDSPAKNRLIEGLRGGGVSSAESRGPAAAERDRPEVREFCRRFAGPAGDRLFTCGAGRSVCVDAYGRLQACMLLRDPDTAYHLADGSLEDALARYFPGLRNWVTQNPRYLDRCARCVLHGLCEQCPAKSWAEHGTLDEPVEYLCQTAHRTARELGLLKPNEHGWAVDDWEERIGWSSG